MADDIVEVLRKGGHKINEHHCKVCDEFCYASELCDCCYDALNSATQAADEIDRLRAERNEQRYVANEVARLRAAGDALAMAYRGLEVADDLPLRAWQEARRGCD